MNRDYNVSRPQHLRRSKALPTCQPMQSLSSRVLLSCFPPDHFHIRAGSSKNCHMKRLVQSFDPHPLCAGSSVERASGLNCRYAFEQVERLGHYTVGVFVELAIMEQAIQRCLTFSDTVLPSPAFLSELLDTPSYNLADISKVRIPLRRLDGHISFHIDNEPATAIRQCYNLRLYDFEDKLYMVLIEIQAWAPGLLRKKKIVANILVEETFHELDKANDWVKAVVERWKRRNPRHRSRLMTTNNGPVGSCPLSLWGRERPFAPDYDGKVVYIVARSLWEAGALQARDGCTATMRAVPAGHRTSFPTERGRFSRVSVSSRHTTCLV